MSFYVGQKVVRVAELREGDPPRPPHYHYPDGVPVKGRVYVISWVGMHRFKEGELLSISLIGMRKIHIRKDVEVPTAVVSHTGVVRYQPLEELKEESRDRYYREHPQAQPA